MTLETQRRLAAQIMKTGKSRIYLDPSKFEDIKKAITKKDVRHLIKLDVIKRLQKKGISKFRTRKLKQQKRKGRRQGAGSRKGTSYARNPRKRRWVNRVRAQREYLKMFRDRKLITKPVFRELYVKSKGGFFRSVRHIRLYMEEHSLIQDVKKKG